MNGFLEVLFEDPNPVNLGNARDHFCVQFQSPQFNERFAQSIIYLPSQEYIALFMLHHVLHLKSNLSQVSISKSKFFWDEMNNFGVREVENYPSSKMDYVKPN